MSAKLLARTTAGLASIDQTLDDPISAAVDRLPGVAGSWWDCSHEEVVQVGMRTVGELYDVRRPINDDCWHLEHLGAYHTTPRCWADDEHSPDNWHGCIWPPATDLGLCAYHHDRIVPPQEATP